MNNKLIDEAIKMRKRSYAPYSKYRVGAAVETESGHILADVMLSLLAMDLHVAQKEQHYFER